MKVFNILFLLLFSGGVYAAAVTGHARVNIVTAVNISEVSVIDFGVVENADGTCTMDASGALSGSDGQTCDGSATPGEFLISGEIGQNIVVSTTSTITVDGVSFAPTIEGSNVRTLDDGTTTVKIIGEITLGGASEGNKNIDYIITANYQ